MSFRRHAALMTAAVIALAATPALGQDADGLAADFPTSIGEVELQITEESGPEWVARFDTDDDLEAAVVARTNTFVDGLGADLEDLTIASAAVAPTDGNVAAISAVRVDGHDAHELIDGAIDLLLGDVISPSIQIVFVDGRDVLKVRDAEMPGAYPRTLVTTGETLWVIEADATYVDEIVAGLPPSDPPAVPTFDLASTIPLELDGNRRVYLLVSSGWDFVYWLGENNPQELDTLTLRGYLASGIPIDAISTTSAVWTDAVGNIGAVVAGYQFAGADQATLDRLLAEVVLPAFEGVGSSVEASTLAGRDVTVLRDPQLTGENGEPRAIHVFTADDTIFVIDAPEATAAAAVEALG